MTTQQYCDVKRYFKNEHREYYRLLKDKLCTGMIFSNVPKCFLVPQGALLEDLKKIKSTEELSNQVKHLILKSNVALDQINTRDELVNINNKVINDTDKLLNNIVDLTKGTKYKPWMIGDKKNTRGYNTVFLYKGTKVPEASKDSAKTKEHSKGKKSGGMWPFSTSNEQDKYKMFASLLNTIGVKNNIKLEKNDTTENKNKKMTDLCNETQKFILCYIQTLAESKPYYETLLNKLLLNAYYGSDVVLSLIFIVKLLSPNDMSEIVGPKSLDDKSVLYARLDSCKNGLNLRITDKGKSNVDYFKNNKPSNNIDNLGLNLDSSAKKIKNDYELLCKELNINWCDKLLFDELKYSISKKKDIGATDKFKWCLSVVMSNKNIIYFPDLNDIDILKTELSENMNQFIKSEFYGYRDTTISGGATNTNHLVLQALEKQKESLNNLISKLKSKAGGFTHNDNELSESVQVQETNDDDENNNRSFNGGDFTGGDFLGGDFLGGYESD